MSQVEYVEPTRRARGVAVALFAAGFGFVLVLHLGWPLVMAHIRALPVCEQLRWFRVLVAAQALLMAIVPVGLAWLGWRVRQAQCWPAPGWLVLRRTPLRRGASALRRSAWLLGAAGVSGVLVMGVVSVLLNLMGDIAQRWSC